MNVQRARFLAVIRVQELFDENKFLGIVDDYHNKLKELAGEAGYGDFLETLHFVFTHNDRTHSGETYTVDQIKERCE